MKVAYAAAPTMTAVASDEDVDGTIDRIVITFSELSDIIDGEAGDGLASLALGDGCTIANLDYAADSTTTLTLDSLTGCTAGDTSLTPSVTYTAVASCATANAICDDALVNQMANAETTNATDGAAPQIKTAAYQDADADGKIDTISLDFTETLHADSVLSHENLVLTVGDFTSAEFGTAGIDLVAGVATVDITLGTESSVVDTYSTASVAITTQDGVADFSLTDGTTENTTPKAEAQVTVLDEAKPVITSTTPTDASSVQSRTNSVVYNFSEPMVADTWVEATEFDSTPDGSGWSGAWSGTGNLTMTLTHSNFICITDYSVAFTPAQITATNGEATYITLNNAATAPIGATHTFTTMSCSTSSGSGSSSTTTYEVDVLTPNGGETLAGGDEYEITWETSPESEYYVDLLYLGSDGKYVEIATGETNDGAYTWTVPADLEDSLIKVIYNDLADELDSDTSDADFNDTDGVSSDDDADDDTSDTDDDTDDTDTSDDSTVEAPSGTGVSPVTGEAEEITAVEPGDFITSPSFSTVYYVTEDYGRRAFISSAVFFTYADSYDEVTDVTDATLTELGLTANMLPNPGVVLVKVQSDAKTYAVDDDSNLRWITSEEVAIDLYGDSWADYIIDVEATFFSAFGAGDDVESSDDLAVTEQTRTRMRTRSQVSQ